MSTSRCHKPRSGVRIILHCSQLRKSTIRMVCWIVGIVVSVYVSLSRATTLTRWLSWMEGEVNADCILLLVGQHLTTLVLLVLPPFRIMKFVCGKAPSLQFELNKTSLTDSGFTSGSSGVQSGSRCSSQILHCLHVR